MAGARKKLGTTCRPVRPHRLFRAWFYGETVQRTRRAARRTSCRLGTRLESTFLILTERPSLHSVVPIHTAVSQHHVTTGWLHVQISRPAVCLLHGWFPCVSSVHSSSEVVFTPRSLSHPHGVCVATVLFGSSSVEIEVEVVA